MLNCKVRNEVGKGTGMIAGVRRGMMVGSLKNWKTPPKKKKEKKIKNAMERKLFV